MWCPRCDQGWIRKLRIRKTGEILYSCEECDATWRSAEPISKAHFVDLSQYLERMGCKNTWDDLELLPMERE
jgi:hypothetical protein